jgi:voltage-gated potassium channel
MYNLESQVQPDVFENAFSGLWWAVATLTTVGYGDIYPITFGGKVMAGIIALLGIGLVAVPTGIISAGFVEMIDVEKLSIPKKHRIAYIKRKNRRPK